MGLFYCPTTVSLLEKSIGNVNRFPNLASLLPVQGVNVLNRAGGGAVPCHEAFYLPLCFPALGSPFPTMLCLPAVDSEWSAGAGVYPCRHPRFVGTG